MQLSSGTYTTNFSTQSGCVLSIALPKNCYSGNVINFGLSGTTTENILISGGKIYDSSSRNIYSINFDEAINYEGYFTSGIVTTFINGVPLSQVVNTGSFNYLNIYSNNLIDVGIKISGEYPQLVFSQLNNFSGSNKIITGKLVNSTPSRLYKITGASADNNTGIYSISGYTTGNISGTGYVYIQAASGGILNSGTIGLNLQTNFGNLHYDIINNPINDLVLNQYLELYPGSGITLEQVHSKEFSLVSFFNSGTTRNIDVKLEYVSGCTFSPVTNYYNFNSSGYILEEITEGSGNLTGTLTGYYTGTSGTLTSGYSQPYVFTGNYTGTLTTTATGLHNGNIVTGSIGSGYNVNLTSGDLGRFDLETGTGLITGITTGLSGYARASFSFGTSGSESFYYLTGYTGTLINTFSGSRDNLYNTTGLRYYFSVYGFSSFDLPDAEFEIGRLRHYPTGFSGTYTESFDISSFAIINYDNYSGSTGAGVYHVYTGYLPSGGSSGASYSSIDNFNIEDMFSTNMSGSYRIYLGTAPAVAAPTVPWFIDEFSFINLPVDQLESINSTGTGIYPTYYITGNVNIFKTGVVMTTGILEYPGQANFYDVWKFKTGIASNNYLDYYYNNFYDTGKYYHSGSYAPSFLDNYSNYYLSVSHNGTSLSGNNISKLLFNDGVLSGECLITGKSEY